MHEQLKMQYECSPSLVNANELENQIESIEAKLTKQSEDFSKSLRTCGSKGPELKSRHLYNYERQRKMSYQARLYRRRKNQSLWHRSCSLSKMKKKHSLPF